MLLLALESTLIAHGLPYPQNLETARELEAIARAHGVEPRTIAIIGGAIKIGLGLQASCNCHCFSIAFAFARIAV